MSTLFDTIWGPELEGDDEGNPNAPDMDPTGVPVQCAPTVLMCCSGGGGGGGYEIGRAASIYFGGCV